MMTIKPWLRDPGLTNSRLPPLIGSFEWPHPFGFKEGKYVSIRVKRI